MAPSSCGSERWAACVLLSEKLEMAESLSFELWVECMGLAFFFLKFLVSLRFVCCGDMEGDGLARFRRLYLLPASI
jgi:hypothetical protein